MEYPDPIIVTQEEASPTLGPDYSQELSNSGEGHKLEALSANSGNERTAEISPETESKQELRDPNPIQVEESERGETTLSYTFLEDEPAETHVGSPDGPPLARPERAEETVTGKWVTDGMVFFQQDASDDKPLTAEHRLPTVKVRLSLEEALAVRLAEKEWQLKRLVNSFAY